MGRLRPIRRGLRAVARAAARRFPRATALAFGTLCALGLLAGAEGALRVWSALERLGAPPPVRTAFASMVVPDPVYGFRPAGSRLVLDQARRGGRLLYEARYALDERGRRRVPAVGAIPDGPLLVTLGCSVAFGTGVNDHETLAAQAVARVAGASGLIFAAPAYGPQHAWLQAQDPDFADALAGRRGLAVYVYNDHHLHRLAGSGGLPPGWRGRMPWLSLQRGVVVRMGFFAERDTALPQAPWPLRGLMLYDLVDRRLARALAEPTPEVEAADATELFAQAMAECAHHLRRVAPEMEFRVLLYPGTHYVNRVGGALAARGVGVLNYTGCAPPEWTEDEMYHHDAPGGGAGHPKAALHAHIGAQLARDLRWVLGHDIDAEGWTPGYCNPREAAERAAAEHSNAG